MAPVLKKYVCKEEFEPRPPEEDAVHCIYPVHAIGKCWMPLREFEVNFVLCIIFMSKTCFSPVL